MDDHGVKLILAGLFVETDPFERQFLRKLNISTLFLQLSVEPLDGDHQQLGLAEDEVSPVGKD